MPRINTKRNAVDAVFKPNDQGVSEWITREIIDSNLSLRWMNGNGRHGIYFNDRRHLWDVRRDGKGNKVTHLRTTGLSDDELYGASRPIRKSIMTAISKEPCCRCGSCNRVEADHKNDFYNDPRVLNMETQTLDDFQPLCRACNVRKGKINCKTRRTGRRQLPPVDIFQLSGVKFTEGDDTYDENDVNWYKGTYWGDVKAFIAKSKKMNETRIRKETRAEITNVLTWPIFIRALECAPRRK